MKMMMKRRRRRRRRRREGCLLHLGHPLMIMVKDSKGGRAVKVGGSRCLNLNVSWTCRMWWCLGLQVLGWWQRTGSKRWRRRIGGKRSVGDQW
jgi:hypothetical protein